MLAATLRKYDLPTSHSPQLGLRPATEPATTVISIFINFTVDRDKRVLCFAHSHSLKKRNRNNHMLCFSWPSSQNATYKEQLSFAGFRFMISAWLLSDVDKAGHLFRLEMKASIVYSSQCHRKTCILEKLWKTQNNSVTSVKLTDVSTECSTSCLDFFPCSALQNWKQSKAKDE